MPILPLDSFLCWKLKHATIAYAIFIIVSIYDIYIKIVIELHYI